MKYALLPKQYIFCIWIYGIVYSKVPCCSVSRPISICSSWVATPAPPTTALSPPHKCASRPSLHTLLPQLPVPRPSASTWGVPTPCCAPASSSQQPYHPALLTVGSLSVSTICWGSVTLGSQHHYHWTSLLSTVCGLHYPPASLGLRLIQQYHICHFTFGHWGLQFTYQK